jgi:hypothetical protein
MASSDERRALAERLRRASACGEGISCCTVDKALGLRYDNDFFGDVFTCESVRDLADLIDPTCEAAYGNPFASDFNYRCMACGEHFSTCGEPKYCPGCGGRIEHVK